MLSGRFRGCLVSGLLCQFFINCITLTSVSVKAPADPEVLITSSRLEFKGEIRIFEGGVRLVTRQYRVSAGQGIFHGDERKIIGRHNVEIDHEKFIVKGQRLEAWTDDSRAQLTGNPRPSLVEKVVIPSDGTTVSQVFLRADVLELLERGETVQASQDVMLERRIIGSGEKPLVLRCENLDYYTVTHRAVGKGSLTVEGPDMKAAGDMGVFEGKPEDAQKIRITGNAWLERIDSAGNMRRVDGRELVYDLTKGELLVIMPYSEVGI